MWVWGRNVYIYGGGGEGISGQILPVSNNRRIPLSFACQKKKILLIINYKKKTPHMMQSAKNAVTQDQSTTTTEHKIKDNGNFKHI
jgi:hypothetical protein